MDSLQTMPASAPQPFAGRPAILVIEDEALIAMMLEDVLVEAGYDVVVAPSATAAAAGLKHAAQLAAVIAELSLSHGVDGRDLIRQLRTTRPHLPVLVLTSHSSQDSAGDLRGLGGPTVRVGKPIDTALMLRRLALAIAGVDSAA